MTITLGTFTCSALTAQPYGYEGTARTGLTARTFRISGLLTATQWQSLRSNYDTWRNLRIQDADTLTSGTVGSTIALSINNVNGISVSNLACWFADPPSGEQVGSFINTSAVLVDANQALEVLLREREKDVSSQDNLPDLGTVTLGTVVIKLTRPLDTRQDGPTVGMTSTGTSYVTGPLKAHKVRQIEGFIQSGGSFADVLTWYDTTISSVPAATSWFPITAPQATAEVVVASGVKSTRYNVTLTALQIL